MAEDFDKERSHIEENETIAEMLPDLLVVKKEIDILNYYDNEFESTPFAVQENKGPLLQEESQSRHFQPPSSGLTNNENLQNKLLKCNKIILGSKPNRVSSDEGNFEESGKIAQEKCDVSIDENYFEELVASYDPSVELQNIQPYLHKSKRFCDSCSILFPERTGYESHLLIFHRENSSPEISHRKSLTERRQHKCTICSKQFVASHVLRRHLRNIHKVSNDKAFEMARQATSAKRIEDSNNAEAIELSTKETNTKGTKDTSNAKTIEVSTKETNAKAIEDTSNDKAIEMTTSETSARGIDDTPKDTGGKIIVNSIKETSATVPKITTKCNNEAVVEKTIRQTYTPKITHESSDLSNTCFHCKKAFDTQKSLIEHLYDILQMKRKNTEIVPVLKSVLFKCHKCDIHFTSSLLAANHAEHMEMLINWKCSICNRIFKKEDELSHERQHSVSNNFLIYNLGDLDVANILFRCSKCATHFTESNFLYHFRDCGLDVTKSFTCKICNITLDYTLKILHEFDKHTESKLFTIIQCDVISDNPVKSIVNKPHTREKLKELLKSFREVKIVLEKIDSGKIKSSEVNFSSKSESRSVSESSSVDMASSEAPKVLSSKSESRSVSESSSVDMASSEAPKVLSSKSESRSVSESSSVDMASSVAPKVLQVNKESDKLWGTRLRKSDNTTGKYRLAHGLNKNHKLLGRRNMAYSYCKNCKCFITKFRRDVHLKGRCKKLTEKARTCEHCGLIMSNISIMAHRRLHMERKDLKLTNFRFNNLFNGRPTNPPIPEYPKCITCEIHFLNKTHRINHICSTESYQTCDVCGIKLSETAFKLHMTFHEYATDRMKRATMKNLQSETLNIDECDTVKNIKNITENNTRLINDQLDMAEPTLTETTNENDDNKLDAPQIINKKMRINIAALRRLNVTYCYCETCKCFVTKFKNTVHIQGRCKNMAKIACTCEHCGLILTSTSMVTHKRLHIKKKDLKLKNFRFFNLYTGRSMNPPIPEYTRCAHCSVHFLTTADRNNHNCNKESYQTCNICETKLSETAFKFHMTFHQYATDRIKRVKSKNLKAPTTLDVINCVADENITKTAENDNELPNNLNVAETNVTAIRKRRNISQKYEMKGMNVFQAVNKKRPINNADLRRRNLTYFFCGTCKCFITKFKKTAHVQGRCKNMAKTACMCELCGLIFTSGSIGTHRRLHMEKKELQLKHFRFFDLYNGQSMNPPIPDYPKCNTCAVHFLNHELSNNHICKAVAHQKCHICDINLSKAACKLHVRFHEYETDRINRTTSKNSQTATTSADFGIAKSGTDENVTVSTENNIESTHNRLDVPEMQLTANTNQEYKSNDNTNLDTSLVENKSRLVNIADHLALTTHNRLDVPEVQLTANANQEYKSNDNTNLDTSLVENKSRLVNNADHLALTTHNRLDVPEVQPTANTNQEYKSNDNTNLDTSLIENKSRLVNIADHLALTTHNRLDVPEVQPTANTNQEYKSNDNTNLDTSLIENKSRLVNIADHLALTRRNVTYSYCENCKCFVTKFKIDSHVQGRCKKLHKVPCTCEDCGLILNDGSIVTHKRLHEENKDLKLKNFKFINIYTGKSMNPPVPEYPKCTHCAVHFLTKTARNKHICSQQAYQSCRLCEMKLSQAAFKRHMSFHQYASDGAKRVTMKNSQSATTLVIDKPVSDKNVTNSPENNVESIHYPPDMSETKLTANTNQESKLNDNIKLNASLDENKTIKNADDSVLRRRNLTYSYCKTCKCFITKFRKDAHAQGRCKKLAKIACTCEHCGLILNDASIVTHRRLHEDRKDLQLKNFRFFNLYTGRAMNPPIPTYPKCKHCTVQFLTKKARNNHICSEQSYQMCHLCETKLSEVAFKLHMKFHQYPKDRLKKDTNINSQPLTTLDNEKPLTDEKVNSTGSDNERANDLLDVAETRLTPINECINTTQTCKMNNKSKLDEFQAVNSKRLVTMEKKMGRRRRNVTYSFCETCKCFITNFKKDAHVQGRCRNMTKIARTCEFCGLILNSASIVTHKRLHEETKDLQLKNFRFFNLYTGRSMNPPIPKYPKCTNCEVFFPSNTARQEHVCNKEAYKTCHLCEIKLSENAFKLHMKFHEYATDRMKRVVMKNSQSAMTSTIEKRLTNEDVSSTTEKRAELICNPLEVAESPVQHSSEAYEIVYTCGNCSVSVDTYDKVVEHCQRHYENEHPEIKTNVCNYCELTIDAVCYMDHYNIHEKGKQFKFLKFDSYFLPADNNMWVTHIFKTLPKEKVLNILRSSIYRFECRIKMEVIQQGDPDLTVYRCDQCNCFIEPGSLFKHSDNSCFKLRQHPCTICGIPFNSSASRIDHEKIHNRSGVTTDLYRIVIFNRERDKQINRSFCLRKNYVLFQCRNCSVIIDNLEGNDNIHMCDVSNVKKCQHCELLIHAKDFEKHVNTHQEFVSFNYSNMKVILLGEDNFLRDRCKNTLASNFKGAIYDYKMFICNKCEICIKDAISMSKHICRFGKQRLKCLKCNLYFSVGRLKTHTRSHEQDPDFIRSNMNIVSFDPCTFDQNKNTTVVSKESEYSDSNTDSDTEILAANDTNIANVAETFDTTPEILEEETVKLYKCTCELHFLNEDSIIRHFGVCRSMATISKQKCPKCDLLFTPNVLFTHLLAHHRKNRFRCKYDVIEMDYIQNKMVL